MKTFLMLFQDLPWWVYLITLYATYIGIEGLLPKVRSIYMLAIPAVFFTLFSVHTLMIAPDVSSFGLMGWGISLLLGILLGVLIGSDHEYQPDRAHGLLMVDGGLTPLFLVLLILGSKFYYGYELAINPALATNASLTMTVLAISAACAGVFVGRFFCYFYYYCKNESVNLKL